MTPDKYTIKEQFLDVGDGHQLYIHDWGNTAAKVPIIYIHGGPGNGCDNRDKKKFDPLKHRVIYFDQRGAGKSTPKGSIEKNTTKKLVEDISKVADELNLKSFVLVGGSWGSTLALMYAISHPNRVKALVIDGVYTATKAERNWLENGGWRAFFPDIWDEYQNTVPKEYRDSPADYINSAVLSADGEKAKKAAYTFNSIELGILKLDDRYAPDEYDKYDPDPTKIELHYISNDCFIEEGYILANSHKLSMPVYIIQGRYDLICPPANAYKLSKKLPNCKLIWTINGHLRQHEAANVQRLCIDKALGIG